MVSEIDNIYLVIIINIIVINININIIIIMVINFGHKIYNINLASIGGKENDKEDWQRASASASSKNLNPGVALFYQVRMLPMIFITNYDDGGVIDGNRDKVMDLQ